MVKKSVKAAKVSKSPKTTKSISVKKAFTKREIIQAIARTVGIEKKYVVDVMDALTALINAHLTKKTPGTFTLPGIAKFRVVRKAAVKARNGKNPFTGEDMVFAAKPARNVVKVRPMKKLKDMIAD